MTVIDDACATVTPRLHEASLDTMRDRYAQIAATSEVLEEVEGVSALRPAVGA